jgi:hypothetical protein
VRQKALTGAAEAALVERMALANEGANMTSWGGGGGVAGEVGCGSQRRQSGLVGTDVSPATSVIRQWGTWLSALREGSFCPRHTLPSEYHHSVRGNTLPWRSRHINLIFYDGLRSTPSHLHVTGILGAAGKNKTNQIKPAYYQSYS